MNNKCLKCGYSWVSKKQSPKACPKCKSYKWNEIINQYECLNCGNILNISQKKGIRYFNSPKACACGNADQNKFNFIDQRI